MGGKPMAGISVTFSPEAGPSSAGTTDSEGKYTLSTATGEAGAVAGQHKVVLSGSGSTAPFDPVKMAAERDGGMKGGGRGNSPKPIVAKPTYPAEYGSAAKTPAIHEVKAGSNQIDVVIP